MEGRARAQTSPVLNYCAQNCSCPGAHAFYFIKKIRDFGQNLSKSIWCFHRDSGQFFKPSKSLLLAIVRCRLSSKVNSEIWFLHYLYAPVCTYIKLKLYFSCREKTVLHFFSMCICVNYGGIHLVLTHFNVLRNEISISRLFLKFPKFPFSEPVSIGNPIVMDSLKMVTFREDQFLLLWQRL